MPNEAKKVTVPSISDAAERGERLVMVTAYDYPQGRTADEAGVDIVLVGVHSFPTRRSSDLDRKSVV